MGTLIYYFDTIDKYDKAKVLVSGVKHYYNDNTLELCAELTGLTQHKVHGLSFRVEKPGSRA